MKIFINAFIIVNNDIKKYVNISVLFWGDGNQHTSLGQTA